MDRFLTKNVSATFALPGMLTTGLVRVGKMFIDSRRVKKISLLLLLSASSQSICASQEIQTLPGSVPEKGQNETTLEQNPLHTQKGLILLDYEVIPLPENESIDLLGAHYLHQLNDWFYLGFGLHAPLVHGDYGGFMAFDFTLHTQHKLFEGLFFNAGASLGGGGGGSSVAQSRELSGTGGFGKGYIGLGYEFDYFSVGVNYAYFHFTDSQIESSQLNFFIQKSLSYSAGSYADSGRTVKSAYSLLGSGETFLTFEANNIFQINPTGSDRDTIHSLSLQFSHFFTNNQYLFFGADVGYKGLPLYNQAVGGIGHRFSLFPRANLYGQIGVGSGGFSPDKVDTGSGLLVYPKVSLEYLLSNELGLSLSGGYLAAPMGTSKNYTLGAAVNYHLSTKQKDTHGFGAAYDLTLKGFRVNLFPQTEFNVQVGDEDHHNVNMLSAQFDSLLSDNWYFATQVNFAYNEFHEKPGYGELLLGLGIQNKYVASDSFQNFFQMLIGTNIYGVVFKPSIATNYTLTDDLALYGQLGMTMSVDNENLYPHDKQFSAYSIGFGLTYRFSLL